MWFVLGILTFKVGPNRGLVCPRWIAFRHYSYRRIVRQQEHLIKHRDQRGMIKYARRMKRFKATPQASNIPIGNHLLLGGILVTVNGVVLDIGFPAWLFERLPRSPKSESANGYAGEQSPLKKDEHQGSHLLVRHGG